MRNNGFVSGEPLSCDRTDIARLTEANGMHLGQDDLGVAEARRLVGPDALIGVSTHDFGQLLQAMGDGASYVGLGPTFPGATKSFDHERGVKNFLPAGT